MMFTIKIEVAVNLPLVLHLSRKKREFEASNMKEILQAALAAIESGRRVSLSTILSARGSLPMSRRSKMLVLADGSMKGTVGGGCLEAEVFARGRELLAARAGAGTPGGPAFARFTLTEKEAGAEGLNCGGTVEILTELIAPGPVAEVLRACLDAIERRQDAVLVTSLDGADAAFAGKILIRSRVRPVGSTGDPGLDAAAASLASEWMGRDAIGVEILPGDRRVFLETIEHSPTVILFGGGHVSREVARVAKTAGFKVIVVDDRPAFASRDRHPEADETRVLEMEAAVASLPIDSNSYLLALTRGHQHDETVIRQALRSEAGYIGMIGSARKVAIARRNLEAEGFRKEDLDRLHAPIGLDIGADNPGEIAVSIVAELVAVRRKGGHPSSLRTSRRGRGGAD